MDKNQNNLDLQVLCDKLTPIQKINNFYVKRDDLFEIAGVCGGKARTCYYLAQNAKIGLTTAGSRMSPQINIVAHIANKLGLDFVAHTPQGELSPELVSAKDKGAKIIQHKPGYNSVIVKRCRDYATENDYTEIPFGMECAEAVRQTEKQVKNIPDVKRIVVTAGSGMSLSGILWGLKKFNKNIPVLAIVVGADPTKRLDKYAPPNWRDMVELKNAGVDYHEEVENQVGKIIVDPIYEAKCLPFIEPGDLFWIIGIRKTTNKINNKTMSDNKKMPDESSGALRKRFLEPPFSIIDGKTGDWKRRKNKWMEIGIKSELGRDATTFSTKASSDRGYDYLNTNSSDVSIFDPALCELMYKWFCPENGTILDPFAGGSVRGIVAHKMGYKYTGIELRAEQVKANIEQGAKLCQGNEPIWIAGDSNKELDKIEDQYDFIFSCPPYADLEVYSKDEDDISNMPYDEFLLAYRSIINKAIQKLKPGHLAVFVVGDVRDADGYYYDFVSDTKKAFIESGAKLYNEAILLDPIGTAMIRANNAMGSKKLVKVHQNILCFKKVGADKALNKKIVLDYINKCDECGGKIKRIDGGERVCQDCMKEF